MTTGEQALRCRWEIFGVDVLLHAYVNCIPVESLDGCQVFEPVIRYGGSYQEANGDSGVVYQQIVSATYYFA